MLSMIDVRLIPLTASRMMAKSSISMGPAMAKTSMITWSLDTQSSSSFQPDTVVSYVPSSYIGSMVSSSK